MFHWSSNLALHTTFFFVPFISYVNMHIELNFHLLKWIIILVQLRYRVPHFFQYPSHYCTKLICNEINCSDLQKKNRTSCSPLLLFKLFNSTAALASLARRSIQNMSYLRERSPSTGGGRYARAANIQDTAGGRDAWLQAQKLRA